MALAALIALAGCLAAFALYGWRVELSGDQNPQIIAAQSLADDGRLLAPAHPTQAPAITRPGTDQRQVLFWFPPGYSLLLAGLHGATGASLATCAALAFWANLLLGNFVWAAWARRVGFRPWQTALAVVFLSTLTRPSTTTDQFATTLVGLLFLIDTHRDLGPWWRGLAVTILLCAAISLRWAATFVALVWGIFVVLLPPRPGLGARIFGGVPVALAALFYLLLSRAVAPAAGLYAGGGSGPPTHWALIWKAFWFAGAGGWSPPGTILRCAHALLVFVIVPATFVLWLREKKLPRWFALLGLLQWLAVVFLAWVQLRYAMMYDPETPAFATARFYSLAKPASILALGVCSAWFIARLGKWAAPAGRAWLPVSLYLLAAGALWIRENRFQLTRLQVSADGFLRETEYNEIDARVKRWNPESLIARDGYLQLSTLHDPRRFHAAGASLQLDRPTRVAVASLRTASPLPWERTPDGSAARLDEIQTATYRLSFYALAAGTYRLRETP